jgi:hypothetical protein
MLSAQYLKQLSDTELVRIASHEVNDLTSSALEIELLARLEPLTGTDLRAVAEEHDADATYISDLLSAIGDFELEPTQLRELLESHPSSVSEMAALLKALNDEDIHSLDQLKRLIAFHQEFQALASDAGDVFERLSTLTTNAIKE